MSKYIIRQVSRELKTTKSLQKNKSKLFHIVVSGIDSSEMPSIIKIHIQNIVLPERLKTSPEPNEKCEASSPTLPAFYAWYTVFGFAHKPTVYCARKVEK